MNTVKRDNPKDVRTFIELVRASGIMWGLMDSDGWVLSESAEFEDTQVLPLWSDEADAKRHAKDEWAHCQATAIELGDFLDSWYAELQSQDLLVGVDWDANLAGEEMEPARLVEELASD
jgi:hypothetical protein